MGDHYNIEGLLFGFYNDKKVLIRESKKEIKTNTPSIIFFTCRRRAMLLWNSDQWRTELDPISLILTGQNMTASVPKLPSEASTNYC
jgi:hypothetical protein